jgi:orotate phosphoribosyltransferase
MLIARLILKGIRERGISAQAIGGLTMGADPIAAATAVVSEIEGRPIPAFIVRKETKGHGMQRAIEGWDGRPGDRVVIVDDVCTSGESILIACRKAEEAGYVVSATFCVVDREEGGTETVRARYPFHPLLTARQLMET